MVPLKGSSIPSLPASIPLSHSMGWSRHGHESSWTIEAKTTSPNWWHSNLIERAWVPSTMELPCRCWHGNLHYDKREKETLSPCCLGCLGIAELTLQFFSVWKAIWYSETSGDLETVDMGSICRYGFYFIASGKFLKISEPLFSHL